MDEIVVGFNTFQNEIKFPKAQATTLVIQPIILFKPMN